MSDYHEVRLPADVKRDITWKVLCEAYFQGLIPPGACTLDLGAGYCTFINNIACAKRFAVDQWKRLPEHAAPGVTAIVSSVTDLSQIPDRSVDFAFASNVFEHLTQSELSDVLRQLRVKLRPGGTLNILQPNYRYAYREYFDDYNHVAVYSHCSLGDFLTVNGFRVIESHPRFLPLTIKSRLPVWPILIRMYLAMPFKPLGKQMFLRAVVDTDA